jgi:hypothetical protein
MVLKTAGDQDEIFNHPDNEQWVGKYRYINTTNINP